MAAQAGLCLAWLETPEDTFCLVVAQLIAKGLLLFDVVVIVSPHLNVVLLHHSFFDYCKNPKISNTENLL